MRKKSITPAGLTPKQERARKLLAVLDGDPSKTGRTAAKLGAARRAVTRLAHLAGTPRTENYAETFAAACAAVNTSGDRKAQELAKRRVNDVLRAFGKLPQTVLPYQEYAANSLREMFEDAEAVSSEKGTKVSDALHTLARLLRVELPDAPDELPEFYLRAIRELEGDDRASEAPKTVYRVSSSFCWKRPAEAEQSGAAEESTPTDPKPSKKEPCALYNLNITDDRLGLLGLVRGDKCKVYEADDIKPGDAVALELKGELDTDAGRVVSLDAEQITIRDDDGDASYRRAEILRARRIDYLNPTKIDPLTEDERKRVNKLRKELDKLDGEDDQIIRCTRRYKLEKEIFDIEHPVDTDDWGAWEEDEK